MLPYAMLKRDDQGAVLAGQLEHEEARGHRALRSFAADVEEDWCT